MQKEIKFNPSNGIVVAKATAFASALELTSNNLPKLEWILEVEKVGPDCPTMVDENGELVKGHLILEYADNFRHVITNNPLSWKVQADYVRDNKLKMDRGVRVKVIEYMLIPYYNIMSSVERDTIFPEHITVYDIKEPATPTVVDITNIGKA